ncbi:MAG: S1 RNA-binding domain-containing protein, partial [Patescibacteria group bacterium]
RLTIDPFEEASKHFNVDKKVVGTISKISSLGATIDLGDGIEGLIKKEKLPPTSSFAVGDEIEATVSETDTRRHRIILAPVLKEKPIGYR